jgi:hypothetical protein
MREPQRRSALAQLAVADCLDSFSTPSARPLSPSHAKDVSAETSSLRDQAIETERRKLMQVNGLLHSCPKSCCSFLEKPPPWLRNLTGMTTCGMRRYGWIELSRARSSS